MRRFALSHNFHVPASINRLLSDISLSAVNTEYDDFLRLLADSKYSKDQIKQIRSQIPLCYVFFESSDKKRENLVIYTLDTSNRVTRWGSYYPSEEPSRVGSYSDFELRIPELLRHEFIFIPNNESHA